MKKTFQKSLIAAAVGVTMSGAFAASVGTSNILFPYISTGANAVTLITLVNGGTATVPTYRYAMKAIGAANSVGCDHQDGTSALTANDVVQFEVSNKFVANTAFANGDTSVGYQYAGGANKQGFLVVNAGATVNGAAGNTLIYGEAIVIDAASGLRLAYSSQGLNTDFNAANPDFTVNDAGATGGPVAAAVVSPSGSTQNTAHGTNVVSWLNSAAVTTSWYVVPLGTQAEMTPSGVIGGLTAAYSMTDGLGNGGQFGAYNMTEAFQSGGQLSTVRCIGAIARSDVLMPGVVTATAAGGTANLVTYNNAVSTVNTADGAPAGGTSQTAHKSLVYKVQSAGTGANALGFISREAAR